MKSILSLGLLAVTGIAIISCTVGVRGGYGYDHRFHRHDDYRRYNMEVQPTSGQVIAITEDYAIKPSSAVVVVGLISGTLAQSKLDDLNIDQSDVAPLASLQMPSAASIHNVADAMGETDESVSSIMHDYINDMN